MKDNMWRVNNNDISELTSQINNQWQTWKHDNESLNHIKNLKSKINLTSTKSNPIPLHYNPPTSLI